MSGESSDVVVGVYYDFASTMCFVAHRAVERIAPELRELAIRLEWRPLDLTRLTGWQRGRPFRSDARRRAEIVAFELDVAVAHPPRVWMDSRAASEVALGLSAQSEAKFRSALWSAVYDRGVDLDGELVRSLLPPTASVPRGEFPRLEEETRRGQALGVAGVPSFVLGEWPVGGIQDDATMLHL